MDQAKVSNENFYQLGSCDIYTSGNTGMFLMLIIILFLIITFIIYKFLKYLTIQ